MYLGFVPDRLYPVELLELVLCLPLVLSLQAPSPLVVVPRQFGEQLLSEVYYLLRQWLHCSHWNQLSPGRAW